MPKRRRYDPARVTVDPDRTLRSSWLPPGRRAVLGLAHLYGARDDNFDSLNQWLFSVQVPSGKGGQVIVRPLIAPGKRAWAGIDRRSIVFVPATKHPYRTSMYCKVSVADPTGEKTKIVIRKGEKSILPKWFGHFQMRLKDTVTTTRGSDGQAQVVTVPRDAHDEMIRLYFAMKIWVLQEALLVKSRG